MLIPPMPQPLSDELFGAPHHFTAEAGAGHLNWSICPFGTVGSGEGWRNALCLLKRATSDTRSADHWRLRCRGIESGATWPKARLRRRQRSTRAYRSKWDAPNGLCLCVHDVLTGQPIGVANFMSNSPEHLKIELGSIWYSPLAQGNLCEYRRATYLNVAPCLRSGLSPIGVEVQCAQRTITLRRLTDGLYV